MFFLLGMIHGGEAPPDALTLVMRPVALGILAGTAFLRERRDRPD